MKMQCKAASLLVLAGLVMLAQGCAPSAASKPTSAPPPAAAVDSSRSAGGKGQAGATKESDTGASSLKSLQEGKPAITPASSPLKDVYFAFDRYDLSAEARTILRSSAEWLKGNPAVRVEIEGHCDERGTNEYNLALGAKRAQAAREYLATLGVASARLSTTSYGEEIPVCRESNESCWKQNRRARFVIVPSRPAS
jgi:peptidoglycan-associated lipoprotein